MRIIQRLHGVPSAAVRIVGIGTVALAAAAIAAQAAPPPAPVPISACGFVISSPGSYVAANDLDATSGNQNCIVIAAPNVRLNLKGFHVFGTQDGTGIGILIRKGANRAIVEGADEVQNTDPPNGTEGGPTITAAPQQSEVAKWKIGIEDDANDAKIALFAAIGGITTDNGNTPGNTIGGVLLNKVTGGFVGVLNANYNGQYGVMLNNSSNVTLANLSVNYNGETGLKLVKSNGNAFGPGGALSNGHYGIWLQSSSSNRIHDSNGNTLNKDTGILLSCSSGVTCRGINASNDNRITNGGAPANLKAGIVITQGNAGNIVTVTHNEQNGNPNSDMIDLNPNCGTNTWYNNVGMGNQPCTQQ